MSFVEKIYMFIFLFESGFKIQDMIDNFRLWMSDIC